MGTKRKVDAPRPSLGSGERFLALVAKLKRRGAKNPAALAAWIGRRVHGAEVFQRLAALARKRKAGKAVREADGTVDLNLILEEMELLLSDGSQVGPEEEGLLTEAMDLLEEAMEAWPGDAVVEAAFLEARDERGVEWEVLLIRAGTSRNGNYYPMEVLEKAAHLFEGVKAYADHGAVALPVGRPLRSVRDVVGWFQQVRAEGEGLMARFHLLESAEWLRVTLLDAFRRGRPDLVGFSIDAEGKTTMRPLDGGVVRWVESIERVNSVDVVAEPAAGGQVVRLVASLDKELTLEDERMQREEIHKNDHEGPAGDLEGIKEALRLQECRLMLTEALLSSDLPPVVNEKIRRRFERRLFDRDELDRCLKEEKETLAALTATGEVKGLGRTRAETGDDEMDRYRKAMDGFFMGGPVEGVAPFRSLREAFSVITGKSFSDALRESRSTTGMMRLSESLTTSSFDQILANSINRRMLKEYSRPDLSDWRKIAEVVAISDFRAQRRMRFGGYANLPTVAEGAAYTALTSPTDEEATYTPAKRGGTEELTLEMIKNDDVGAIRRIPVRLGRAAAQTLHEFVFDFLSTNPTIYDATALFTAGHGNLGSAALSAASLVAGRNAMLKQSEMNSGKRLAIRPRHLVIPIDLEETAFQLITSDRVVGSNQNEPNFIKVFGLATILVEYWADTNNWYLVADPGAVPTIEIGFLEGREEPELFVQDMEGVGSMFNNDKIIYKIRHVYGGAVMDYRCFYGSIVV